MGPLALRQTILGTWLGFAACVPGAERRSGCVLGSWHEVSANPMVVAVLAERSLAERPGPTRLGVAEVDVERRAVRWRGDVVAAAELAECLANAGFGHVTEADMAGMSGSVRVVCAPDECEQLGDYIRASMPMLVMVYEDGRRECTLAPSFQVRVDQALGVVAVFGNLLLLGDLHYALVDYLGTRRGRDK